MPGKKEGRGAADGKGGEGEDGKGRGRASLVPEAVSAGGGKYRFYDRTKWGEAGDAGPPLPPRKHEWKGRHKRVSDPGQCEKKGPGPESMPRSYRRTAR